MNCLIVLTIVYGLTYGLPLDSSIDSSENERTFFIKNFQENGENYEGDMILTDNQFLSIQGLGEKNGISDESYRWPNKIIPYELPNTFTVSERRIILEAIATLNSRTCLRFKRRSTEIDFISFQRGNGCSSNVGRIRRRQFVTLGSGCILLRIVLHELLHAVGFFHMQSATDRDNYVNINWNNIQPGKESNFKIASNSNKFWVPYDVRSIMHYSSYAFSRNNRPTITTKIGTLITPSTAMTAWDILRVNNMYKC